MKPNSTKAKVLALRNKNFTRRQIAQTLGITMNNVHANMAVLIKEGHVKRISKKESQKRQQTSKGYAEKNEQAEKEIIELIKLGYTYKQVSEKLNQPRSYIAKIMAVVKPSLKEEFENSIIQMYRQDVVYEEIAARLHTSCRDVCKVVQRFIDQGILQKRKTKTRKKMRGDQIIIDLYNAGASIEEIATELNLVERTVIANISELIKQGKIVGRNAPRPRGRPRRQPKQQTIVCAANMFPTNVFLVGIEQNNRSLGLTEKDEIAKKKSLALQLVIIQLLRESFPQSLSRNQIIEKISLKHPDFLTQYSIEEALAGARLRKQIYYDGEVYKLWNQHRF